MRHAESTPGTLPKIAISAALIALVVAAIHLAPAPRPPYEMVDAVMRAPARWEGERVRIHGWVKPGTIREVTSDLHVFTLYRAGYAVRVWHHGAVPDTMRDGSEVIVDGTVDRAGKAWWVSSTAVFAKCPTKYEGFPVGPPERFR